jgi:hypothetical protein
MAAANASPRAQRSNNGPPLATRNFSNFKKHSPRPWVKVRGRNDPGRLIAMYQALSITPPRRASVGLASMVGGEPVQQRVNGENFSGTFGSRSALVAARKRSASARSAVRQETRTDRCPFHHCSCQRRRRRFGAVRL